MTLKDTSANEFWYDRKMDESLNRWFASYEDAAASLALYGGYLLPFRNQFVVCGEAAIRGLGLDPFDPDWKKAGHNVVNPADSEALERLRQKREQIRRKNDER